MPSTVIRYHFYNSDKNTLTIVFVSGLRYEYFDVSQAVYDQFNSAFAKGIYFNEHIKPHHECRKVE